MDAHHQRQPEEVALLVAASLALGGCASPPPASDPTTTSSSKAGARDVLPFIHDDYPHALAEARKQKKPIFVDSWAPWCHSCLSMKSYVFTDPALAPLADRYVWLAIDTERDSNAAFVAKFTHDALPTLWVIDAERETVTWRWTGTLTAAELRDALTREPTEAETTARATHDRVMELAKGDEASCARLALAEAKKLPRGTPRADILVSGLECAVSAKLSSEAEELLTRTMSDAQATDGSLLADDRSALYEAIVEAKKSLGDEPGAKVVAAQWAKLLEDEAAKAKTPAARAVFDPHRLGAYLALGQPQRAVARLEQSERDFPDDYNPPVRLAKAYLELKKLDDAAAAAERARARVYGPRVMRVLVTVADIAKARGDLAGEKKALAEALARTEKAALTSGQKKVRDGLAKRLADLSR